VRHTRPHSTIGAVAQAHNRSVAQTVPRDDCADVSEPRKTYPEIGQRLRALRTGLSDLNASDWADRHGFNRSQYYMWERGARRIPVEAAEKLADLYGLSLDWIYRGRRDGLSENVRKVV